MLRNIQIKILKTSMILVEELFVEETFSSFSSKTRATERIRFPKEQSPKTYDEIVLRLS